MAAWCQQKGDQTIVLTLYIQPGAKSSEISGEHGEALKIRLAAPPVEGKANQALIRFLSEKLAIPKQAITLLSGETNRNKRVQIIGLSVEAIENVLLTPPD
ncbi:DUF167 domain-containing protein [Leeia sp. TBRC 13508]|uniref:UPF0235 protein LIN78_05465 n=1 Tax=Leeia speluncae TaxID=2884804 RepID=A0ABS8D462_9NEIS|nr:DUF167 domain-containing protein [Leeia speluncae]MCB6182995.1 DUF167 domain-containing protein [Leeia speluncae]